MRTLHRLLLLGLFAAAGVALALVVALSLSRPAPVGMEPAGQAASGDSLHNPENETPRAKECPSAQAPMPDSSIGPQSRPEGKGRAASVAEAGSAEQHKPKPDPHTGHDDSGGPVVRLEPHQRVADLVRLSPHPRVGRLAEASSGDSKLGDSALSKADKADKTAGKSEEAGKASSVSPARKEPSTETDQPMPEALPAPEGVKLPGPELRVTAPAERLPSVAPLPPSESPASPGAKPSGSGAAGDAASAGSASGAGPTLGTGGKVVSRSGTTSASAPGSPASPARPPGPNKNPTARITTDEGDDQLSIHIQNADIREVLELLGEKGNLNILAGNNVQGKVSASLRGVDIDSALKAILRSTGFVARREGKFIYVGTADELKQMEESLDRIGTRVYRPNYVTATELQTLIQPLLTARTGICSVSSPAEKGISADTNAVGGNSFAGGDVVLVRDYEAVLAQIDQVVMEIDVRPLQVAIEAMILSVKLEDGNTLGVDFQLLRDKQHIRFASGSPPSTLANFKFEQGALKFGFLDSSLGLFLEALETIGDVNVIATPRLMVLNKQRAQILIGEQLGYVSTMVTETAATQSVEFLDVGAQLRLRPFISRDGLIRMEIHPELSTGSVKTESGFTLPNKEVTQVTTNIMVRDGCTVVIGGLMRNELKKVAQQVPLLGNLPLVGPVFRHNKETTERREIIVLITPRIVYEPETCREGDRSACEFHRRHAVYSEHMNPFSKRWVARRYFRLAQNAWAQGDRERAMRFADLAVHFDPTNRAAIDLRSDIWLGRPVGEHTERCPTTAGCANSALDGPTIPPWVLNDLEQAAPAEVQPRAGIAHPLDRGQPGDRVDIKRPRVLE